MSYTPNSVIVNYIPHTFTDPELYRMFSQIGRIESCRVMKNYKTGVSYGYGFVNYTRPEDAERAIIQLDGKEVQNKRLKVSRARRSTKDIKDTNLYITHLPRHWNEDDVEALFGHYGTIIQKKVLLDQVTGLPRGVAFVRYQWREQAQEAIRHLDGVIPIGGIRPLVVKVAEDHGKLKAAFYAGWNACLIQIKDISKCPLLAKMVPLK